MQNPACHARTLALLSLFALFGPVLARPAAEDGQFRFRAELLSLGVEALNFPRSRFYEPGIRGRIFAEGPTVSCEWHRVRVGISGARMPFDYLDEELPTILPVHVGYTIWERPRNYAGRLLGKVPEIYVQASPEWGSTDFFGWRVEAAAAIDLAGFGLTASAGVQRTLDTAPYSGPFISPFIGVRANVLSFCAGF